MSEETAQPDRAEEDFADEMDDAVPGYGYAKVPVVGLGGSAGSIEALQSFFATLPSRTGLAYVVVIHLSPEHESMLSELLQRCTRMQVVQVRETLEVRPDTVYVIPPRKLLQAVDGRLTLQDVDGDRTGHVTVDLFFRTLADSHGPHAAAVVLSGMNGDGAIGIKRIKERGGLTISQDPEEAAHSSMPRTAIGTGMVDWVLPVQDMPARLLAYFRLEHSVSLPPEAGPEAEPGQGEGDEAQLRDVLNFLRMRTSRDFSHYKRATVLRRIGRRMQVNGVDNLPAYLNCLRTRPGECGALLQDLLISVTNFFRDPECFSALESYIPSLFEGKGPTDAVRVWVIACATGEEAYSLAMMLSEYARTLESPPLIQVFATDLDEVAVQAARDGVYPAAITADVNEERLRRFFTKEHRGYRVRRELREMVLFAVHDVLRDSPFSRQDLVTCRNLLIYLAKEAQARVFDTVHFSLVPAGKLFLGSSESVDEANPLFITLDKKHRIYQHRSTVRPTLPVLAPALANLRFTSEEQHPVREAPVVAGANFDRVLHAPPGPSLTRTAPGTRAPEAHLRLLEHLGPPSVLVDSEYEILHLSPSAGRFLQLSGGEPSRNLLRSVPAELRIELRAALFQAAQTGVAVDLPPVSLELPGGATLTSLRVVPAESGPSTLYLVMFTVRTGQGAEGEQQGEQQGVPLEADPLARHLDLEIDRLKAHLRDTVEQYEASTEELKASNEELQAMNEELRAATEELETSREELQSINEELTTVNHELKGKVDQLSHANSDMQNLMDATAIATVFLDRELRIMRYTPAAVVLFNLIPGDVGRPLTDMATQLEYPELGEDARRVLQRLVPIEREVGQSSGNWYLARVIPYRTLDDRIAGIVFTFIDITERKQAEEMRLWLSAVVSSTSDAIISFALDQTILSWNSGAQKLFGYSAEEAIGQPLSILSLDGSGEQQKLLAQVAAGRAVENFETVRRNKDGADVHVAVTISPITDQAGHVMAATAMARDITAARAAAEALRQSEERLRLLVENVVEYAIFSTDLERRITIWNTGAQRLLGYTEQEAIGQSADVIFTPEDRAAGGPDQEARLAHDSGRAADERQHVRKDGSRFQGSGVLMLMRDGAGQAVGYVKILRDLASRPPLPPH